MLVLWTSVLLLGIPPASACALTLREAIRAAEDSRETLKAAVARVDKARAARLTAYTALFPNLSAVTAYRRRARQVVRDVGGQEVVIQRLHAMGASAVADMRVFDAAAYARIRASSHALNASLSEVAWVRRELWFEVAESFVSVIAASEVAEAARQRVERAQLYATTARRRLDAGLANRNVATRAELELAAARIEETRIQNALTSARLSLGYLIAGEVPQVLVAPQGPLLTDVPEEELVARARALRPDIKAREARVAEATTLAREPWLRFVPVVDAGGTYTWTNEAGFNGQATNWNVAVTATWMAFEGGSHLTQAHEARAELEVREQELAGLRRRVRLDVRLALNDLASAMQGVAQADNQREVAVLNQAEVTARFDHGLTDALTLADATQQAYEADAEVARQALALRLAEIAVLRAVGAFTGDGP